MRKMFFDIKNRTEEKTLPFISSLGPFRYPCRNEVFNYFRNSRIHVYDKQPFRPLFPLTTNTFRWKHPNIDSIYSNSFISLKLYPSLVSELKSTIALKQQQILTDFRAQIISIRNAFHETCRKFKVPIMNAVFTKDLPSLEYSDIFTIVESTINTYESTGLIEDIQNASRFNNSWLYMFSKNQYLIIYGNEKPSLKLKQRIKTAISYCFALTTLLARIKYLAKARIESDLSPMNKIELIEFIFSVLDPTLYSSERYRSVYLPSGYQRKAFNLIFKYYNYVDNYNEFQNFIFDIIIDLDHYEQLLLLSRRNIITNSLRKRLSTVKFDRVYPFSNKREETIFNFMLHDFEGKIQEKEIELAFVRSADDFIAITSNYIRKHIFNWKGYLESGIKITVSELRKPYPDILTSLKEKNLIITSTLRKTKAKRRYYALNLDNIYVKSVLYGK